MRIRKGSTVLVTLVDGSTVKGTTARRWWWNLRLLNAAVLADQGAEMSLDGSVWIPRRSILLLQVVG